MNNLEGTYSSIKCGEIITPVQPVQPTPQVTPVQQNNVAEPV